MKILIDDSLLTTALETPDSFPEFCEQIMQLLLPKNLSIGSCELDGTLIQTLDQAHILYTSCKVCKIESISLSAALIALLKQRCEEAKALEATCEDLVTQALLAEPIEIVETWQKMCEEIKAQIGFFPRLAALLTEKQIMQITDRLLFDLGKIMKAIHKAFNAADTVEISDILELQLLPWLQQMTQVFISCSNAAKTLK